MPSFISSGLICESGPEECYSPPLSLLEGMWARGPGFAVVSVGTRDRGDRGTVGCCLGLQMGSYAMCTVCAAGQEKMRQRRGWAVKSRLIRPDSTGSEARIAGEQGLLKGRSLPSPLFLF